jgi:hypothetical protein
MIKRIAYEPIYEDGLPQNLIQVEDKIIMYCMQMNDYEIWVKDSVIHYCF